MKRMVELFKELRHIKPQALHFYRLYMFLSFETSATGSAEIMLVVVVVVEQQAKGQKDLKL